MLWKYFDLKYLSFTELKEPFLKFLELLLIWVSRRTTRTCSTRTLRLGTSLSRGLRTQFCRHIHERRAPSNSSQLLYVISKVKRTKLFLTAYVHFAPSKSSTFATLMPTSSYPLRLIMSSLAINISPTKITSSFTYP